MEKAEKRPHSPATKTPQEHDRKAIRLEGNLDEAGRKIARLEAENAQFRKSLLKKDRTVEELSRYRSHMEADLKALLRRLESAEKENASLKYEVRVLERELEIRHEEREFNRRISEAAHKQHQESTEKIERLETECRRLRSLVQKRLPGPAALTRMKNEAEKTDHFETRSGKSSPFRAEVAGDASTERGRYLYLHSPGTLSDMGSDGKAESLVSALISDIEDFRNTKKYGTPSSNGYMGTPPEMNLMDDFAEMEKLAYHSPVASDRGNANKNNNSSTASIPIQKIIRLLEGISIIPRDGGEGNSETYTVRVFRSETAEYSSVLKQFLVTCNALLSGKGDLEQFGSSVASNLEWILNHSFSLQDLSSMTDYGRDMGYHQPKTEEVGKGLDLKLGNKESSVVDLERRLQSQNEEVESFRIQLKDSKDLIKHLQSQVQQPKDNVEDQAEEHMMTMKQESETQLVGANPECREPREEISLRENDMENYDNSYQESDESCNDLKPQLEGETGKEIADDGKQLQNDIEITTASEKLAECQETLRNLGKQFKALASPRDTALFDKFASTPAGTVITTPSMSTPRTQRNGSQRLSLLDKMLAEDTNNTNVQIGDSTSTKDVADPNEMGGDAEINAAVSMAIVPCKKKDNRSFFKKLIWWQKKGRSKKKPFS